MQKPPLLANETDRLDALRKLDILDTCAEKDFDDLTALASAICETPICLVSLLDADRQWFKSRVGLAAEQTSRDISFCGHAIQGQAVFEVPNATEDPRFADNPMVVGTPSIRFYAGAPLIDQDGFRLGTLCVIDQVPRQLSTAQKKSLETLANQVVRQMEFRAVSRSLIATSQQLARTLAFQTAVLNSPESAMISVGLDGVVASFSAAASSLLDIRASEVVGLRRLNSFYLTTAARSAFSPPSSSDDVVTDFSQLTVAVAGGLVGSGEWWLRRGDGSAILVRCELSIVRDEESACAGYLVFLHDITALKNAQSQAVASQQLLRKVAERVPGVIYQFLRRADGSSCFPYASNGLKTLLGIDPATVVDDASPIYACVHPDDLAATLASIDQSATLLTPWKHEHRIRLSSGKVRWILGTAEPEKQIDGSVLWHGFMTDITERKEIEDALHRNRHFLQTLIDNLPVGIYSKRMRPEDIPAGGKFIVWNSAAEQMSGIKSEDVIGRMDREVFPNAIADVHAAHDAELLGTRLPVTVPIYAVSHPDGSKRLLRMTSIPLLDEAGEIEYTMGISEDLTELLSQQKELRHRTAELEAVNDSSPLGLFQTDLQGICVYVNRTYETITGRSADSCIGTAWISAIHPDDQQQVSLDWSLCQQQQSQYSGLHRYLRASGKVISVRIQCTPIKINDERGAHIVGFVGTIDDITVRRAANDAIAASEKRLRLITNNVPCTIGYINASERFEFCNVQYKTMLGRDPAAMLGKTLREAFGEIVYGIIRPHVERVLTGHDQSFERTIEVDGLVLHQQCEYIADVDDSGHVAGFYALVTDVTGRHIAAMNLARTERRLRAIAENIPALVAHIDKDQRYVFVNKKLASTLHKSSEELLGAALHQVWPTALYNANRQYIERALAGESVQFESRLDNSGVEQHFQAAYIPDWDNQNKVAGFFAMVVDVTAIKTNELRRIANEKRLRTITDNIPVGITYIDAALRFQFVNATMCTWTATAAEDIVGTSVRDVIGEAAFTERTDYFARVLSGQQVEFVQTSSVLGAERVLQSTYVPDIADDGTVKGFYTLSSDISALKKTENELIQLARFDALTGLKNRVSLFETIHAVRARCRRNRTPFVLMYLDIDHFKTINDSHGHSVGDLVLQEFARRLGLAVRETDSVARLGGDEFVIVLEALQSEANACDVAQKILDKMHLPWVLNGDKLVITTSIGILYDVDHRLSPQELLKQADDRLYDAKNKGRDQFSFGIAQ